MPPKTKNKQKTNPQTKQEQKSNQRKGESFYEAVSLMNVVHSVNAK